MYVFWALPKIHAVDTFNIKASKHARSAPLVGAFLALGNRVLGNF